MATKTIRVSEKAFAKLTKDIKFGEHLPDVIDKLLGITTDNTTEKKGVRK